jgi:hypothetical protein
MSKQITTRDGKISTGLMSKQITTRDGKTY